MASKSSKRRRKRRRGNAAKTQPRAVAPDGSPEESAAPAAAAVTRSAPSKRRRDNIDDAPPPAPWGSFPLVELAVFVGLVMLILGFFVVDGSRGPILVATGLVLGSIGGFELSIREHFAGYRSHTLILAGIPAAVVLGILFYAGPDGLPSLARAAVAAAVFAAAAVLLTRIFRDRSGGQSFRFSSFGRR